MNGSGESLDQSVSDPVPSVSEVQPSGHRPDFLQTMRHPKASGPWFTWLSQLFGVEVHRNRC